MTPGAPCYKPNSLLSSSALPVHSRAFCFRVGFACRVPALNDVPKHGVVYSQPKLDNELPQDGRHVRIRDSIAEVCIFGFSYGVLSGSMHMLLSTGHYCLSFCGQYVYRTSFLKLKPLFSVHFLSTERAKRVYVLNSCALKWVAFVPLEHAVSSATIIV